MQGLILQLTRAGFLLLLWLFIWAVLRTLRSDIYAGTARPLPRYSGKQSVLPSLSRGKSAKYLVVTQGALAGTRITLSTQPVLIGRADDSTFVLSDDYASTRHARLSPRGSDWYVEDLGSTNGTWIDRTRITGPTVLRVGAKVRVGRTTLQLQR